MRTRTTANQHGRADRLTARMTWVAAALALIAVGLVVWRNVVAEQLATSPASVAGGVAFVIALLAFVISGAIIVSRQPRNVVGWLLLVPGLTVPLAEIVNLWLMSIHPVPVVPGLIVWFAVWFHQWSWLLLIFPIFHLLFTFPDGTLLSSRWRWVVVLEGIMAGLMVTIATVSARLSVVDDTDEVLWSVSNPIGFLTDDFFAGLFGPLWTVGLLTLTLSGLLAFVLRFRRGRGEQRLQLKWPMYGITLFGGVYVWTALTSGEGNAEWENIVFGLALAGIPISVGIAVLRYRLYEIDRIISRTITYAVAVGSLGLVFFGLVALLGSSLGPDNELVVAGATLAVAALFNPWRRRIQAWVDRRFNRSKYDNQRVVAEFVATLRDTVDSSGVIDGWLDVVSETMHPSSASAWVRETGDGASST